VCRGLLGWENVPGIAKFAASGVVAAVRKKRCVSSSPRPSGYKNQASYSGSLVISKVLPCRMQCICRLIQWGLGDRGTGS